MKVGEFAAQQPDGHVPPGQYMLCVEAAGGCGELYLDPESAPDRCVGCGVKKGPFPFVQWTVFKEGTIRLRWKP